MLMGRMHACSSVLGNMVIKSTSFPTFADMSLMGGVRSSLVLVSRTFMGRFDSFGSAEEKLVLREKLAGRTKKVVY